MNKKYIMPLSIIASITIFQAPGYSQLQMPSVIVPNYGFQPNESPTTAQRGQPGLSNLVTAWENETDTKKKQG